MVEFESGGPVRARFSKLISPRSGDHVITGGRSTASPGAIVKSTLLPWNPSPETGAAYQAVGVPLIQDSPPVVHGVDAPGGALERGHVDELGQPPLERALERPAAWRRRAGPTLRRERRARDERRRDQGSQRGARPDS